MTTDNEELLLPDIDHNDSERLCEFCRVTSLEVRTVGMVSAATSLELIGYIRELEARTRLSDSEARAKAEGVIEQEAGVPFDSPSIVAEFKDNVVIKRLVDRIAALLTKEV